jgi:hypothetical protein
MPINIRWIIPLPGFRSRKRQSKNALRPADAYTFIFRTTPPSPRLPGGGCEREQLDRFSRFGFCQVCAQRGDPETAGVVSATKSNYEHGPLNAIAPFARRQQKEQTGPTANKNSEAPNFSKHSRVFISPPNIPQTTKESQTFFDTGLHTDTQNHLQIQGN